MQIKVRYECRIADKEALARLVTTCGIPTSVASSPLGQTIVEYAFDTAREVAAHVEKASAVVD